MSLSRGDKRLTLEKKHNKGKGKPIKYIMCNDGGENRSLDWKFQLSSNLLVATAPRGII
jgi:hypothetical protein